MKEKFYGIWQAENCQNGNSVWLLVLESILDMCVYKLRKFELIILANFGTAKENSLKGNFTPSNRLSRFEEGNLLYM